MHHAQYAITRTYDDGDTCTTLHSFPSSDVANDRADMIMRSRADIASVTVERLDPPYVAQRQEF